LAYILDSRKHTDEKIELLKKCKEFYPEAENADAYLGRTYYMIGDLQNAEKYNDNALIINPNNGFAIQTKELIETKKE
jgi:tetratricopeptide (TPR) repeat protein